MVGVIRMCQSIRWVRSHMPPWCASVIIQLISARYHGGYIGWVPTMAVAGYHAPVRSGWPIHRVSAAHRQVELFGVSNPQGSSCPVATGRLASGGEWYDTKPGEKPLLVWLGFKAPRC